MVTLSTSRLTVMNRRWDDLLDITLCLEIALLAVVLLQMQWHPPIRPFPQIFPTPPSAPER